VSEQARRASLQDLDEIVRLVRETPGARGRLSEAEVTEWLYSKGVWVALCDEDLVGVAAWQAENLLAVTDVLHVAPVEFWPEAGDHLLEIIEGEAQTLMCEANVVLLPALAPEAAHAVLRQRGYERKARGELHRIWREVLSGFAAGEPEVLVKRLRERMVMMPV
jgi:N-acetylglutamate synthase-like GNAT family acetyltransferase